MSVGIIIAIIAGVILLALIIYVIKTYNTVNRYDLKCSQAFSGIDISLQKRHDMLTKMLATAKQYANFERETLIESIEMRQSNSVQEQMQKSAQLDRAKTQLFGLMENYPQLQASKNYEMLQAGIMDSEDNLQAARRTYNANVNELNALFVTFPTNIIAGMTGKKQRDFFEADEEHRQDVQIDDHI